MKQYTDNYNTHIKKISKSLPQASWETTRTTLQSLRTMLQETNIIAKEIENLSDNLQRNANSTRFISCDLSENESSLRKIFDKSNDIIFRPFKIGSHIQGLLLFVDGFIDNNLVNSDILKPLLHYGAHSGQNLKSTANLKNLLKNQILSAALISEGQTLQEVVDHVLSGDTILLVNGFNQALFVNLRAWDKRSVEEPAVEPSIRGPREGFTEALHTNTILVRKRLKTPNLKMEPFQVGRLSKTDILVTYIEGIANPSLIEEVRSRIARVDIDAILESGNLEELIEDSPFSLFPQFAYTERPDKLTSCLLEGQVGIMLDNTPFALIAPQTFFQMMQAPDDYYERFLGVTFIRLIRYLFLFIALLLPSLYIAFSTYNQGMIPFSLLLSMTASRENVPFPALVEALIMEIFFEGLREAGVRLPRPVGQTVSIVGALVIGQAAVQAGIVSAPTVIIVSITGIASFIIPRFNEAIAIRVLRFVMMALAGTLGLYGVFMGMLFIIVHMASLRSLGVPYLSPIAPFELATLKDVFVRAPLWAMLTRPQFTGSQNMHRMRRGMRPRAGK